MTYTPERIWATMMDPECARSGTFVDLKKYPTKQNHDAIEYIRVDVAEANKQRAVAAALRKAAEAAWEADSLELATHGAAKIVERILALIPDAGKALDRALAAERERCASVAEAHKPTQSLITNSEPNGYWRGVEENAFSIAAAIRAQGDKT